MSELDQNLRVTIHGISMKYNLSVHYADLVCNWLQPGYTRFFLASLEDASSASNIVDKPRKFANEHSNLSGVYVYVCDIGWLMARNINIAR